jgi:hypothetical protein
MSEGAASRVPTSLEPSQASSGTPARRVPNVPRRAAPAGM